MLTFFPFLWLHHKFLIPWFGNGNHSKFIFSQVDIVLHIDVDYLKNMSKMNFIFSFHTFLNKDLSTNYIIYIFVLLIVSRIEMMYFYYIITLQTSWDITLKIIFVWNIFFHRFILSKHGCHVFKTCVKRI
jgi:hypothetical protein